MSKTIEQLGQDYLDAKSRADAVAAKATAAWADWAAAADARAAAEATAAADAWAAADVAYKLWQDRLRGDENE